MEGDAEPPLEAKQKQKRKKVAPKKTQITLEEIQSLFHLPLREAAAKLGCSQTYFKQMCRLLGVPRWPRRAVNKSLNDRSMRTIDDMELSSRGTSSADALSSSLTFASELHEWDAMLTMHVDAAELLFESEADGLLLNSGLLDPLSDHSELPCMQSPEQPMIVRPPKRRAVNFASSTNSMFAFEPHSPLPVRGGHDAKTVRHHIKREMYEQVPEQQQMSMGRSSAQHSLRNPAPLDSAAGTLMAEAAAQIAKVQAQVQARERVQTQGHAQSQPSLSGPLPADALGYLNADRWYVYLQQQQQLQQQLRRQQHQQQQLHQLHQQMQQHQQNVYQPPSTDVQQPNQH